MDSLAAEVVLGERGILEQFLEYTLADIAVQAVIDVAAERERERVTIARRALLRIKYFRTWKKIAWELNLKRRGALKRQRFADSMREMARSARNGTSANVASSLEAHSLDPIARMPAGSDNARISSPSTHRGNPLPARSINKSTKRKSLPTELQETNHSKLNGNGKSTQESTSPTKRIKSSHKRSHTLGESINSTQSGRISKLRSSRNGITNKLLGVSSLLDPKLIAEARHLITGKTDTTRTDYFRLKAMGIDPDTPVVPKTRKRSRVADPTENAETPASKRPSPNRISISPNLQPSLLSTSVSSAGSGRSGSRTPRYDADEEHLFAQARKLREAMAEGEAWFREEREREEQRRSNESQRREVEQRQTPSKTSVRLEATGAAGLWERAKEISRRKLAERDRRAAAKTSKGKEAVAGRPMSNGLQLPVVLTGLYL